MYSRGVRNRLPIRFFIIATLAFASILIAGAIKIRSVSSALQNPSAQPANRRVQVLRFTLYDTSFYPQEARASQGFITVAIEDLTGSSSGLLIERVDSGPQAVRTPVGALNKPGNLLRSRQELYLPEGRYELIDSSRPDTRAVLIVTTNEP